MLSYSAFDVVERVVICLYYRRGWSSGVYKQQKYIAHSLLFNLDNHLS